MRIDLLVIILLLMVGCSKDKQASLISDDAKKDPDFTKELQDQAVQNQISARVESFTDDNNKSWKLTVLTASSAGPTIFLPHDNENAAFEAGQRFIKEYGGKMVAIDCNEKRSCQGVDPNRYFTSSQVYADKIFSHFKSQSLMITLHNNQPGYGGSNGTITACQEYPWSGAQAFQYNNSANECDNLIVFNGETSQPQGLQKELQSHLHAIQINAVYEQYSPNNDGSASYAATARNMFYVNVETVEGDADRQFEMLERFYKWYTARGPNSMKSKKKSKKEQNKAPKTKKKK